MAKRVVKQPAPASAKLAFSVDEYNKIVGSADLQTVQALKVSLDVDPEFYDESAERKFGIERDIVGVAVKPEGDAVAGTFRFAVTVKHGRKRVLKATAEYLVLYGLNEGADHDAAMEFCQRVGIFAAYPYFRALMAQLSWEANAQLPIMPVIATKGSRVKALDAEA